ncbi:MAG: nuclear transport factor 2 family protein [Bacteroidota bacterium]
MLKQITFVLFLVMVSFSARGQHSPSMKSWTKAWLNRNEEEFKGLYAKEAIIFPSNKKPVIGDSEILNFMLRGFGRVKVTFNPSELIIDQNMAFESGKFRDWRLEDGVEVGNGLYAVSWALKQGRWQILSHSWWSY